MDIAPAAALIPYLLGLVAFCVFGAFALYRLFKFGAPSAGSWLMVLTFCLGAALVLATSLWQLSIVDWSTSAIHIEDSPIGVDPYAYQALD